MPGKRGTGWEETGSSKNHNSTSPFSHSTREKSVKCPQKSSDSAKFKTIIPSHFGTFFPFNLPTSWMTMKYCCICQELTSHFKKPCSCSKNQLWLAEAVGCSISCCVSGRGIQAARFLNYWRQTYVRDQS